MNISYECSELIEELKRDIEEFGDKDMYAFFEEINCNTFLTNYDFIVDEKPLSTKDFKSNTKYIKIMKASEILRILEEQNSII